MLQCALGTAFIQHLQFERACRISQRIHQVCVTSSISKPVVSSSHVFQRKVSSNYRRSSHIPYLLVRTMQGRPSPLWAMYQKGARISESRVIRSSLSPPRYPNHLVTLRLSPHSFHSQRHISITFTIFLLRACPTPLLNPRAESHALQSLAKAPLALRDGQNLAPLANLTFLLPRYKSSPPFLPHLSLLQPRYTH